jgi:hypothetical protein
MSSSWMGITAVGLLAAALIGAACGGATRGGTAGSSGSAAGGGSGAAGGGGAGGAAGSGALGGSSGAGGGISPLCESLSDQYSQKLTLAKQCNPLIDAEQCTLLVQSALVCGCSTFVSTSQQIAVSDLMNLKQASEAAHCADCCACAPCEPGPLTATCQPKGSVGVCVDVY